jgi:hypothetical protein
MVVVGKTLEAPDINIKKHYHYEKSFRNEAGSCQENEDLY